MHPQPGSYLGNVNCIGIRGVYDEAKRFSEALTFAYRQFGLQTRIVRIFNTYGERMQLDDGRALPNFGTQALTGAPITVYGDGSQTRSFTYVSDLVDGIVQLLDSEYVHPMNIGNPDEVSLLAVAKEVKALTQSDSEIVFQGLPPGDPKVRRRTSPRHNASSGGPRTYSAPMVSNAPWMTLQNAFLSRRFMRQNSTVNAFRKEINAIQN